MNYGHIDFLPKSYRDRQAQQSRGWRQWALLLIVAAGLAGWWHVMRTETQKLRTVMLQVEDDVNAARDQRTALVQLKEECLMILKLAHHAVVGPRQHGGQV